MPFLKEEDIEVLHTLKKGHFNAKDLLNKEELSDYELDLLMNEDL